MAASLSRPINIENTTAGIKFLRRFGTGDKELLRTWDSPFLVTLWREDT